MAWFGLKPVLTQMRPQQQKQVSHWFDRALQCYIIFNNHYHYVSESWSIASSECNGWECIPNNVTDDLMIESIRSLVVVIPILAARFEDAARGNQFSNLLDVLLQSSYLPTVQRKTSLWQRCCNCSSLTWWPCHLEQHRQKKWIK